MLTREVSSIIPGGIGNRSMMTRGGGFGASRLRFPPRRVIICDAPGASLRDASITSLRDLRSHRFAMFAIFEALLRDALIAPRSSIFDRIASRCFDRSAILDRTAVK